MNDLIARYKWFCQVRNFIKGNSEELDNFPSAHEEMNSSVLIDIELQVVKPIFSSGPSEKLTKIQLKTERTLAMRAF